MKYLRWKSTMFQRRKPWAYQSERKACDLDKEHMYWREHKVCALDKNLVAALRMGVD